MGAEIYHNDCKGCKYSQRIEEPEAGGGIIELEGNWILNHYGDKDSFLGRMALQPRFHRMELTELNTDEANALGKNIQNIDLALRQYWVHQFPNDLVQRVYVVYFFESAFEESPNKYHLHIHLIPRTERFRSIDCGGSKLIAWNIYKLNCHKDFPPEYRIWPDNPENKRRIEALMTYLRAYLRRSI